MNKLFTSESVTIGHPDKMCDQISDAILDEYLKKDKNSRVACEVCANSKNVVVMGEITSDANIDIEELVRNVIIEIGYDNDELLFNGNNIKIDINITKQSNDIAMGVNKKDIGAGDQGMMFGYATNETEELMPLPILLASNLASKLTSVRKEKILNYLRPDGKTQVTIEYDNDIPIRVHTIVISAQHNPLIDSLKIKNDLIKYVINEVIPTDLIDEKTLIYVNPTGRFVIGGPASDSGLTGRKIIVDTYGGICGHGGGAFSGKDYTKVDRSGAYYARYVAKHLVASDLCSKCEIQVSYAIGLSKPISICINTFNTNKIKEERILNIINKYFDFSPNNIIKELNLKNITYSDTTCFSHFGRDNLPWEKLDKLEQIKKEL